jgi:hypothetical protein
MRVMEAALHYFVDLNAEIFGGGDFLGEFGEGIQIFVAEAGEHFPFDKAIQIDQVADHAGFFVDRAAHCYFNGVIVAVAEGIVAFAVGRLIFLRGHGLAVQAVRRGEEVAAGEMGFHNLDFETFKTFTTEGTEGHRVKLLPSWFSVEIYEEIWGFVDSYAVQF